MTQTNSVVAVYETHDQAEAAVRELQRASLNMKVLSLVGKDTHADENMIGFYNTGDRMKAWGGLGAFWGGLWGLLLGSAFFVIPGLGPIVMAGPIVSWLVGGLEGAVAVSGLSAVGGALASMGIPKESVLKYEAAIKTDKLLLVVHGDEVDVKKAHGLLATTAFSEIAAHSS